MVCIDKRRTRQLDMSLRPIWFYLHAWAACKNLRNKKGEAGGLRLF
jgi:hypothetical protein